MPYIGNQPADRFGSLAYQDLTGVTGSPVKRGFTLNQAVANEMEIEVFVNNVRQEPTVAYTVSGTALTMTGDVETTDDFYVVFQGKAIGTVTHPSNTPIVATTGTFSGAVTASSFTGDGSGITNAISFAVISDQKTSGTAGGTSVTSFTKRDLNTEVFDPDGIVTISSDQFTLGAGTYIIDWQCPGYRSNNIATLLYDVTAGANGETGTSSYSNTSTGSPTVAISTGRARVVLTANNTYEIRMKVSSAYSTAGLGVAANSDPETYTTVHIMKIG